MLRTMLIGLDGSDQSKAAVELGLNWAKKTNALLVGLGVIDEPALCQGEWIPLGGEAFKGQRDEEKLHQARLRAEQVLEHFALQCAQHNVPCKLLEDVGSPTAQIVLQAQRYDLIMLGQHTFFSQGPLAPPDDTLTEVLKQAPRPVVVVPANRVSGHAVVVAFDGSLQATRTLQLFQACLGKAVDLVHVISIHADHTEASRHAERAVEYLRFHQVNAQPHPIATGASYGEVLLAQIEALDAGLLVMGAFGKPMWREFLLGSVTRTLLNESSRPLFLYQ